MTKRPSLFSSKGTSPAPEPAEPPRPERAAPGAPPATANAREPVSATRYPKATTREGKRVVTAYLDPEAFRQLKRLAADTDAQQQDLFVEGINLLFEKYGLSRIA